MNGVCLTIFLLQGWISKAEKMDDIEEIVTKNATFNGSGHLVDTSIDKASDKG